MKTTTNNKIISTLTRRSLVAIILSLGLSTSAQAQMFCQAAFTYTTGSSGQVSFTNASTGTNTNTVYYWTFGDNSSSNVQSPNHTYTYNGGYRVWLTIDSANGGCSSSATDSITITNGINCNLAAAYTYTAGSSGSVNFTDASTGVDPGMIYSWSWYGSTGSGSSSQQSPTLNFVYNGTYYVTMNVGDPTQSCSKSVTNTIVVTNGQTCQASFTYTVGANGVVAFTNTSQGSTNYYWTFGDGTSSTVFSPTHTYAYNGGYNVYLYGDTTGGGCGAYVLDSITITTTTPAPTCSAGFTYTLGSNGQVSFTNTSTGTVTNPTYSWAFGDGGSSVLSSPSYTYAYNGTYNVTVYELDSIGNYICNNTQVITITNAANLPCNDSAYFYIYQDSSAASTWDVYLYTSNSLNYPTNATWYWGDGTSSTGLYPAHTYTAAGWYNICVMAYYACGDSSYFCQPDSMYKMSATMISVYVINTTNGIKNIANNLNIVKAYPNPFTDNITLNVSSVANSTVTYSISDVYGNLLMNEKVSVDRGENKVDINTSSFSHGIYFVNVTDSNSKKIHTLKIVK